ncbi:MAG: sugar phosphate nucleotidyltransferase [Limnochordia bacterium]
MARRIGIVELDSAARILSFEEKPQEPKSSWGVPALYIYKQETLPLVKQYLHARQQSRRARTLHSMVDQT